MNITIVKGAGSGVTPLAAFDSALLDAGVPNYNLIALSSVIPPGSMVTRGQHNAAPDQFGDRMYVVMARQQTAQVGETAWAGLGWVQEPSSGRGLMVELHGSTKQQVYHDIHSTLTQMIESRPDINFGSIECEMEGVVCDGKPVCALVIAIYTSEPWQS